MGLEGLGLWQQVVVEARAGRVDSRRARVASRCCRSIKLRYECRGARVHGTHRSAVEIMSISHASRTLPHLEVNRTDRTVVATRALTSNSPQRLGGDCVQAICASKSGFITYPQSAVLLPRENRREVVFRVDVVAECAGAEEGVDEAAVGELAENLRKTVFSMMP